MAHDLNSLLTLAQNIAVEAGKEVMKIYDSGDYDSFSKDDESPVTTADYAANDIICKALQTQTPDIPIMSEESDNGLLAQRKDWSRYWLIDPIDGTQEFIARSGDFAVNIALIENHVPVLGVIYWPPADTLYYGTKGQGAFKKSVGESKQIRVRKFDSGQTDVVNLAISRRQPRERVTCKLDENREYQNIPLGSCSLKACFIAEGKADLFLRIGVTGEWDTGASQCIVAEAGGDIRAHDFEPLSYNQRDSLENPNFIVMGDQNVDWKSIVVKH